MSDNRSGRLSAIPNNQQVAIAPQPISQDLIEAIATKIEERLRDRPPSPFAISTWDQLLEFAEKSSQSLLIPESFRGKPSDIVIAVMFGQELGLPAIQSIQSIASINGRPSIWGEAVPGLCLASGKVLDHYETWEGVEGSDSFTAVCVVHRKGMTKPQYGRCSVADIKTAGLYGKAVHAKYPKIMMMWRARHQAWHGAFPDILRGIGTREIDAEDREAATGPEFTTAPPKLASYQTTPTQQMDSWDNSWFLGWEKKLLNETKGHVWADILVAALEAAPTMRDVLELGDMPCVIDTIKRAQQKAPDVAKRLDDAFTDALARFAAPSKPAKPARREFFHPLLDHRGDPLHDELFTDPLTFAKEAAAAYAKLSGPHMTEAFLIENEDGIAEARAVDPEAARILDGMLARSAEDLQQFNHVQIHPAAQRDGKPDWRGYPKQITDALAKMNPSVSLADWLDAQYEVLSNAPAAPRLRAVQAIRQAGIGSPSEAKVKELTDALINPQPKEKPADDQDDAMVDGWVANLDRLRGLATSSPQVALQEFRMFVGLDDVSQALSRLEKEKPALYSFLAGTLSATDKWITDRVEGAKPS